MGTALLTGTAVEKRGGAAIRGGPGARGSPPVRHLAVQDGSGTSVNAVPGRACPPRGAGTSTLGPAVSDAAGAGARLTAASCWGMRCELRISALAGVVQ